MNAKYVYSEPIAKVEKNVYVDANGNQIATTKSPNAKYSSLPRYTVCSILDEKTRTLTFGVARCSSKDRFNKKVGRELSLQRALNNPVCTIQVPISLKISDVTVDVALQLMNRYEQERTLKF